MKTRYSCLNIGQALLRALAPCWQQGLAALLGVLLTFQVQAQQQPGQSFFTDDAAARKAATTSRLAATLRSARSLTLDVAGMQASLATAPLEKQAGAQPLVVTLPLPDGTTGRFKVVETPVMAPELAAQFPSIKTYAGVGVDDPAASVRLDLTPRGFHAQVLSATTGDFFIDPTTRTDTKHYLSFWRRDMSGRQFNCDVKGNGAVPQSTNRQQRTASVQRTTGNVLRTYRLAVAATGEYTAYQGGTVLLGLAAIVTTVNRVVGVYEKELAVRMVLVASDAALVYTNATTDPYTNGSPTALLRQNQTTIDNIIGTANYDIGHVFSTAGGGVAGLGVVCSAGRKAQGETGTSNPVGDAFDIDYVAHEMGHQFGGNHTFNSVTSNCGGGNRNASTAYEPGSGTTIMAYAGICGADNTQLNSNAYFHVASYEEIQAFLATTTCGTATANNNTAPTAVLPASGKVLPISTPFKLTAGGYDTDGDALTYDWEEYDLGPGGPLTAPQVPGQTPPLFRSFNPTPSPTRYFPRLTDLVNNTTALGERLPTVTRPLNFRVTLRDQHQGNLGVIGGVNSSAVVDLSTTSAAGPFLVTAPNTAVTLAGGSSQAVTWAVAGTDANGVNCATVNIRLSTDGGLTYPTLLLAGTANDGSEGVVLPSVATTTARIMVEAADNYFFDISNTNFTITTTAATACNAPTNLSVGSITATTAGVSFTPSSSAASYVVTTLPATTTQTVSGTSASLTGLTAGTTYTVSLVSNCTGGATSPAATTTFSTVAPPLCNSPTNLAVSVTATTASVSFTPSSTATSYTVTTTPSSTTQTVTGSSVSFSGLTPGMAYTANIVSNCAGGGSSTVTITFATPPPNNECATAASLVSGTSCLATTGTVTGATQSLPVSTCSGAASATAQDVWYTFVATGTTHTVEATSDFDGVLQLFSGTCGSLTSVTCIDDFGSGGETLALTTLTPNTRYYVRYYPYTELASQTVTGTFTICVTNPVPPCNAPTNLVVSTATTTTATVSFTPSSTATSYTVTTLPATTTQTVTSSPVSLTGLTPGTTYVVSLVSNCAGGGTATATVSLTTAPAASLSVLYQTGDLGQPGDNVIRPYLQLVNKGTTAVPLQQVSVRYWLTVENFAPLVASIDWAQLGTSQVSARYVALPTPRQGAFGYVEYTFLAGAGSLAAGSNSGPILTSVHKQNWTDVDETNDYSYAAVSAYAPNDHLTVYQNGVLVSGTEPAVLAATTALKVYAGNQDTAPTTSAISVYLQVGNVGNVPVNYQDLTVRYWFTPDGPQALVYPVDYAPLGASNFSLQTGQRGTNTYAELRFAAGLGTFYPLSNTGLVQFRIRKADWSALDQTNDYSFRPTAAVTEQPRITAYLNGQLVYGTEPTGPVTARPDQGATIATTLDNLLEGGPNPFTDQVQLRFTLAHSEAYSLAVYDMQGRLLEELPGGTSRAGQPQQVTWTAGRYAAGLYLVRLRTASTEQHLKFIKQ